MGGLRFPHLNSLSKSLWQFCEERNIFVFASYVSSQDNKIADAESRRQHPDTESDVVFNIIVIQLGVPDIDLFASRTNNKCHRYIWWQRDPGAYAITAFTIDRKQFYFYEFSPYGIIIKLLKKIITDGAEGIVVAPVWPTQPWFPLYQCLLCLDPVILEPSNLVLFSSFNSEIQPKLTLIAGRLSAKRF